VEQVFCEVPIQHVAYRGPLRADNGTCPTLRLPVRHKILEQ
jgi:hypothetical protein